MPVSDSATLHHTCILVKDLDKAAGNLAKTLGVTWNIWTIAPENCFVNGKPASFSFRVALAQVGGANFELLSPHSGSSIYDEYLKSKGEGYHHTCFAYADLESMHAAMEELKGQGYNMVQNGHTEGAFEFCYFELTDPGVVLELLYIKELPPPEKTI